MNLLRALVVDPDESARCHLVRLLEEYGFDSVEAAGGPCALQLASHDGIDLIVSDVRLPRRDGLQLFDAYRGGSFGWTPPPLILCADPQLEEVWMRKLCLDDGVHLLARPFTPNAFAVVLDVAFPME